MGMGAGVGPAGVVLEVAEAAAGHRSGEYKRGACQNSHYRR
jgi:hypothetical protein